MVNLTGAVIIDDFDEELLEKPFLISDGGVVVDGKINWNLGTLTAGETGSLTYQTTIRPAAEFPAQRAELINNALLDTDQTAPVVASVKVDVIANRPPTVDVGGPTLVNEGGVISLTATGSDPDNDLLNYAWDLDFDGSFQILGQTVDFWAAVLDGPSSQTVEIRVTDPGGLADTDQATIGILNVAPTIENFGVSPRTLSRRVSSDSHNYIQ